MNVCVFFHILRKNSRWLPKMAGKQFWKQDHCRGVYLPPSIEEKEYLFRDIHNFSFSAKIQDDRQKWRKLNFFPFA